MTGTAKDRRSPAQAERGTASSRRRTTHSLGSIRELVSAGLGVALLAESAAYAAGPAVQVHSLDPPLAHPPIGVIQVRGRVPSPAARAWHQYLCGPGG